MSRSGYSEDFGCDSEWQLIMWRGAVDRALTGKRGQAFLRELIATLDAMPVKELGSNEWVEPENGTACALGIVAQARGLEDVFAKFDPDDDSAPVRAAQALDIAPAMAREIVWVNDDEEWSSVTPEQRWKKVRDWAARQIENAERKAAKRAARREP